MSNYNLVESLIASGKEMLTKTFVNNEFAKQEIPCNLDAEQEKLYRYSLFTGYQEWVTKTTQLGLSGYESLVIFSEVKQAAYRGLAKFRVMSVKQTTVIEQVVVIDEVAVLKAELAAMQLALDSVLESKSAVVNELMKVKLSMRVHAQNGVKTRVYQEVVSKVRI